MSIIDEKTAFADLRSQMRTTMDQAWKEAGTSQEELETGRRLSDLFACELAAGRTPTEIETAWEGKTAEEILREYSLPTPPAEVSTSVK